eukprot:tig00000970_g5831.t1
MGATRIHRLRSNCLAIIALALLLLPSSATGLTSTAEAASLPARARQFLDEIDVRLAEVEYTSSLAAWRYNTNLTAENQRLVVQNEVKANALALEAWRRTTALLEDNRKAGGVIDDSAMRELELMRVQLGGAHPDPAKAEELAEIAKQLEQIYGSGKVGTRRLEDLERLMATSDDYDVVLDAWRGWRESVGPQMRALYERMVALLNEGARASGFADAGARWRASYLPLSPKEVEYEVDRLWGQLRPLYTELHCVTRDKLSRFYGKERVDPSGLIPAHILGNMWAQDWQHIFRLVAPYANASSNDATARLVSQGYTPERMYRLAESFFRSIGLEALPGAFWRESMLERPRDGREVVCHASAWDMNAPGLERDVRIKACAAPSQEDLFVAHHEMGHCYYYLQYASLRAMHRQGAHDGFHEAVGDAVRLSVSTPKHLYEIGLADAPSSSPEATINAQMLVGLEKIPFLPFALSLEFWRWRVFSGQIPPSRYTQEYWNLYARYAGVAPAVERKDPAAFDPGAKYHIAAGVPYLRYFFSFVLQFQMHAALCSAAGHQGPLHECSIYGSKEAGTRLRAALAMGRSRPWPDVLEALTGKRAMDAGPLLAYFEPLRQHLREEIARRRLQCGWRGADRTGADENPAAAGDYSEEARRSVGQVAGIAAGCLLAAAVVGIAIALAVRCARARRPRRYTAALQEADSAGFVDVELDDPHTGPAPPH